MNDGGETGTSQPHDSSRFNPDPHTGVLYADPHTGVLYPDPRTGILWILRTHHLRVAHPAGMCGGGGKMRSDCPMCVNAPFVLS